jgi:hypothetical protein
VESADAGLLLGNMGFDATQLFVPSGEVGARGVPLRHCHPQLRI